MVIDTNTVKLENAAHLFQKGDISGALNQYHDIIKTDRSNRDAYVHLATIYSRLGRYDDAIESYTRALTLKKDYITFFNIGSLYYKKNEYKKAILFLEKAKQLNGNFILSFQVMGLCYSQLNNLRAAEKNFCDVLNIWPANRVALTALAIMYYNQQKFDESLELLDRLIALDDSNAKIRELKRAIHERTGELTHSLAEIKKIKNTSSGYRLFDEFIKSIPVEVYADRYGTLDEKIERLTLADRESGNLISLSLCHLFKGDSDSALEYLFEARRLTVN